MKIEIVTTQNESLCETGFGSLKACNSVLDSIERIGHDVKLNICNSKRDLDSIVKNNPDLVVLAVKYISLQNENDIWLSDYFHRHGINFTGSSREVLRFDSNKISAKIYLANKGIKTAKYFTAIPEQYQCASELPIKFPLFLKPTDAANGNGIDDLSFVTNFSEFESKVLSLYSRFSSPVLVEEYLDGREFTVSIINTQNNELIISPIEIVPPESKNGLRILGQKVKSDDSEELKSIEDDEIKNAVIKLAINSFMTLSVRDFGRIDIRANKAGDYFFIEANLVPGMTYGSSYFPKSCEIEHALTYDEVIQLMLASGLCRAEPKIPLKSGSQRYLTSSPHTTLHAAPHRAVH
ncbi:MAG: D-alanine--D-alanine ligase [Gammaproteobacteria bacterium]|nr:MAG: D-alanine--D-alanine ligase [Gammaproteobacteria bacterium]